MANRLRGLGGFLSGLGGRRELYQDDSPAPHGDTRPASRGRAFLRGLAKFRRPRRRRRAVEYED